VSGRFIRVLLSVAILCVTAECLAQGYRDAEVEYNRGQLLMELRDYPRAIFAFNKAYGQIPDNRYLAGLVKACFRKGEKEKALVFGERYVDRAGDNPDQEVVEIVRGLHGELGASMGRLELTLYPAGGKLSVTDSTGERRMQVGVESPAIVYATPGKCGVEYEKEGFSPGKAETELAREGVVQLSLSLERAKGESELVIDSNVTAALVTVDGKNAGSTPVKMKVEAGSHVVQVWARNHLAWTGVVDAPALKAVSIQAGLVPAQGRVESMPVPYVAVEESGSFFSLSLLGWTTMALGVGAGGAAAYEYLQFTDTWAKAGKAKGDEKKRLESEGMSAYYIALGAGGAAAALIGGGLLMVLLDDDEEDVRDVAPFEMLTFSPGWSPGGLVLDATFSF